MFNILGSLLGSSTDGNYLLRHRRVGNGSVSGDLLMKGWLRGFLLWGIYRVMWAWWGIKNEMEITTIQLHVLFLACRL